MKYHCFLLDLLFCERRDVAMQRLYRFKTTTLLGTLCLTLSCIASADPGLPDIKEGLWELTLKSDITAAPTSMPSVAYTSQRCLDRQTAGDPHTLLQNNNCEISDLNLQTNLATWKMLCRQQGKQMTGDAQVSYQYESFNGVFNMIAQGKNAGVLKITTQTTGHYIGDCI